MTRINTDDFWDSLTQSARGGADRIRPHVPGIIRASEAIIQDLKDSAKEFVKTEQRVREKLNSGARRTKRDVV